MPATLALSLVSGDRLARLFQKYAPSRRRYVGVKVALVVAVLLMVS